ncbi:MAG: ribosomal maturation YjgA family protein [Candidatus Electronema sp. VV]
MTKIKRSLLTYLPLAALIIALGLPARIIPNSLPSWYVAYAGDFLWAMLVYLVYALILRLSTKQTLCFALVTAYLIELSQLFHPVWLDYLRAIKLLSFILGFAFLWSDILAYTLGIALAACIDFAIQSPHTS